MSDRILIEGLQVEALVGVYPHERDVAQRLLLDLELDYDNRHPAASDAVADTIDYAAVCVRARALAGSLRPQLLETLAEALAAELLRAFAATSVRVRIRKPLAARALGATSVGVEIRRSRGRCNGGRAVLVVDAAQREYALVLGSNHQPARALRLALGRIGEHVDIVSCAPALRTRAEDGGRYLNAALRIRSPLTLPALRAAMHRIEVEAGRRRGTSQVALDIDIVASRDSNGRAHMHKPEDLQRGYVRVLLAQIGFEIPMPT